MESNLALVLIFWCQKFEANCKELEVQKHSPFGLQILMVKVEDQEPSFLGFQLSTSRVESQEFSALGL